MYGIGFFEVFLVFLVLLLFFRPKEILSMFRRLGAWYRRIKNLEDELRSQWDAGIAGDTDEFGFDAVDESREEDQDHDR